MPFQLGGVYRVTLIATSKDADREYGRDAAVLFENGYLKDGEAVVFRIEARTRTVRESRSGEVTESVGSYEVVPNHFGRSILRIVEFKLLGERTDLIDVDCGSSMCDNQHLVKCTIVQLTEAEARGEQAAEPETSSAPPAKPEAARQRPRPQG